MFIGSGALGSKIRAARVRLGLRIVDVAKLLGVASPTYVHEVESGRACVSEARIRRFAELLGVEGPELDGWFASNGVVPVDIRLELVQRPERWDEVRALLREERAKP